MIRTMFFSFSFIIFVSSIQAQNINTPDNFPDPNFRAVVEEFMGVEAGGEFTAADAAGKTGKLDCSNRNIESVTGLEYFKTISEYWCDNNPITQIDLSNNTMLTNLVIRDCNLSALDISNNVFIEGLALDRNRLKEINVSNNTNLKSFSIPGNLLSTIDISNNSILDSLHVGHNQLSSLDTSNNPNIRSIICENNFITELDFSANSKLESINCAINPDLSSINVLNCQKLRGLELRLCNVDELDVSNNPELISIFCGSNRIKRLDLRNNTKMIYLWSQVNQIEELLLPLNGDLEYISTYRNNISDISDFTQLPHLRVLDVRRNDLDCDDWETIEALREFLGESSEPEDIEIQNGIAFSPQNNYSRIFDCEQNINTNRYFRDSRLRTAIEEFMGVGPGGAFTGLEAAQKTGVLDLSGRGITTLNGVSNNGLSYFINVDTILLNDNELTDVSILLENGWAKPGRILDVRNNQLGNNFLVDVEVFKELLQGNIEYLPQQNGDGVLHAAFNADNGHFYAVFDRSKTWNDAKEFADSLFENGYLCTVTSHNENDFLIDIFGTDLHGKIIGGFQSPDFDESSTEYYDDGWNWITGEEWEFANWGGLNPDDWKEVTTNGEDFLNFIGAQGTVGTWNDIDNIREFGFIVEWDQKPSNNVYVINPQDLPALPIFGGNTIQGQSGTEIVISIPGSNLTAFSSLSLDLSFDSSLLTFQSVSKDGTLTDSWAFLDANIIEDGKLIVAGLGNAPVDSDGTILSLHFTISDTAQSGSSTSLSISNVVGIEEVITEPITVTIGSSLGDLNGDDTVNILDVQILFESVLGRIQLTPAQAAAGDLDNNGTVNILDVQRLFNVVLGREELPAKTVLTRVSTSQTNQITIESITVNSGDFVQLPLRVSGNSDISAIEGTVVYDNSKLEYTGFDTAGSITEGFSLIDVFEVSPGQLNFAGINGNAVDGNGALLFLTFSAKADTNGETVVRFDRVGGDLEDYTVQDGIVNIGNETEIGGWMLY